MQGALSLVAHRKAFRMPVWSGFPRAKSSSDVVLYCTATMFILVVDSFMLMHVHVSSGYCDDRAGVLYTRRDSCFVVSSSNVRPRQGFWPLVPRQSF
jgi:hypothetical protein